MTESPHSEFPGHQEDNRRIWDANARWWDDRIGDGNDFQDLLIEPATERLLAVSAGETILDVACGAGRFARRLAALGARVVAFDQSAAFVERARERTPEAMSIDYRVLSVAGLSSLRTPGAPRFDKAVCTMALMDMPEIDPLFQALPDLLKPGGAFVFSISHPCFNSAAVQRFAEMEEDASGRHVIRTGVRVTRYLEPVALKTEGILGQPEPQWLFHRPLHVLMRAGFAAGFVVDGFEEPALPGPEEPQAVVRWRNMPDIAPVLVVRMRTPGG